MPRVSASIRISLLRSSGIRSRYFDSFSAVLGAALFFDLADFRIIFFTGPVSHGEKTGNTRPFPDG
jgi:hypothetical protein